LHELTLLHTAKVHRATFDKLRDVIAPNAKLNHLVRADWLARSQGGIDAALAEEIAAAVNAVNGPVVCTCTTLGEVAEAAGAIRVDQPMMAAAAATGKAVMMAYCLYSTLAPSGDLLAREMAQAGNPSDIVPLDLSLFWPLFEAGEFEAFAAVIAAAVRDALRDSDFGAVVLAQASMAGAATLLADGQTPVFASPEMALRAGLAQALA